MKTSSGPLDQQTAPKRRRLTGLMAAAAAAAALVTAASPAHAEDRTGKIGIGADTSLAFTSAFGNGGARPRILATPTLGVVYQATPSFGAQLLLTTDIDAGGNDGQLTESDFGIALRALIGTSLSKSASIAGVIGLSYLNRSYNPHTPGIDSQSAGDIGIELGLRPEWFVTDHLSFHTQLGVSILILDDSPGNLTDPMDTGSSSAVALNIGAVDLLGNVGFTFYF